jgi:hypothetical protein
MKRRVLNLLTAGSLLLFAAVCVLWLRSYWVDDEFVVGRMYSPTIIVWRKLYSAGGTVGGTRTTITFPRARSAEEVEDFSSRTRGLAWVRTRPNVTLLANLIVGWNEQSFTDTGRVDERTFQIPYWMLAAATGVLPGRRYFREARRRRRLTNTCCGACGYDLRATPDRCPECGAAISPAGAA